MQVYADDKTHPTPIGNLSEDPSILNDSTTSRLNIGKAGLHISKKSKVSPTDLADNEPLIQNPQRFEVGGDDIWESPISSLTRQASRNLNPGQQPTVVKDLYEPISGRTRQASRNLIPRQQPPVVKDLSEHGIPLVYFN